MSITVKNSATVSATGGTDLVLTRDGLNVASGSHLVVATDSAIARRQATFKYKAPTLNVSTGKFSKQRNEFSYAQPVADAITGAITFATVHVTVTLDPSLIDGTYDVNLRNIAAQLLIDSELAEFWSIGKVQL